MITVWEAIQLIESTTTLLSPVRLPLRQANGKVLAEDVYAQVNVPVFDQSAMDGYAFRFSGDYQNKQWLITDEVAAGSNKSIYVHPGQAIRIFTGAPMPEGTDTVVMQEKTEVESIHLLIKDDQLVQGRNVRTEGSDITKGALALSSGTFLTPASLGFLAGMGIQEVLVYPQPTVSIIVTGNELQKPGVPLKHGQIYDANSVMLEAALKQFHVESIHIHFAADDLEEIRSLISVALDSSDLVLITGGVSVGCYDHVVEAATQCGVSQLFHKVRQRPGKPLYAGRKDSKFIFGLPGNPASVMTCFYVYVTKAIECLTGRKDIVNRRALPLFSSYHKKIKLTQFLKAYYTEQGVHPLAAQESFRLSSFAHANALIVLPEEKMDFDKGEVVDTIILPKL